MTDKNLAIAQLTRIAEGRMRQGNAGTGRLYGSFHAAIKAGITTKGALAEAIGCNPKHLPTKIDALKPQQVKALAATTLKLAA